MPTRMIENQEWPTFFDLFSREHRGEAATLLEIGSDIGSQVQVEAKEFVGVSYDRDGSAAGSIAIMLGANPDDNFEQIVRSPSSVYLRDSEGNDSTAALEISSTDGLKMILELHRVPALAGTP